MTAENRIREMVEFMQNKAPDGWRELKMRCRYFDDAMEIQTRYRLAGEDSWATYLGGDFTLMDLCEALAAETHPAMEDKWTKLDIVVGSDGSHEYQYGFGDPGIFES